MDWLEFSVTADGEAAEAIVELFNRFGQGGAVIVKLQRNSNHVISLERKAGGDDRAVDTPGHRNDDAGFGGGLWKAERVQLCHGRLDTLILSRNETMRFFIPL